MDVYANSSWRRITASPMKILYTAAALTLAIEALSILEYANLFKPVKKAQRIFIYNVE